jgi:hypothetical protein
MGLFKDIVSFGTKTTKQVTGFVAQNAGAIPVVGGALSTGASIQYKQMEAIDKAIGNVKGSGVGVNVDNLIQSKLNERQADIDKQKEISDKLKKDKEKKILIYGFSGLGVILIATIAYIIIKKNQK